jgi:gluconokinase
MPHSIACDHVTSERVLAFDMGTSSARAMVLTGGRPGGQEVPSAASQISPVARRKVSVDVEDGTLDGTGYLSALVECVDELHAAGALDGVSLVATAGQWHSVVPVDTRAEPLGPVLTWLDTRPAPTGKGPAEGFHQRTGTWWHSLYWTVRLPWLRERLGGTRARFLGLPELVLSHLLDEAPMSVSMASGTGMLDLAGLDWDAEACALARVREGELPDLAPRNWRGTLRPEYARRWPALREAAWAPPTGDGAASNVGSGCEDERRAAVTVGTSAAVRLIQQADPLPPLPEKLWRYRVDHDRVVTGAAYSAGGNLYTWARQTLQLPDALEAALEKVVPGEGVWADPRLAGDRPPGTASARSGQLHGIGLTTTAVEIWAGLMDGVCRLVAADLVELEKTRTRRNQVEVVLGGGAVAASAWWRRAFRAALVPRTVTDCAEPEVGAVGAARVALAI